MPVCFEISNPLLLSTSPHEQAVVITRGVDRTTSLWISLSWLDKVGWDTRNIYFVYFFTAWSWGGETWVTDQTLCNSDYCWNMKLFNTYLKLEQSHSPRHQVQVEGLHLTELLPQITVFMLRAFSKRCFPPPSLHHLFSPFSLSLSLCLFRLPWWGFSTLILSLRGNTHSMWRASEP